MATGRRVQRASSSAVPIDSSESTGTTVLTSVAFSCEWTSLTTSSHPEVEGDEGEKGEPGTGQSRCDHDEERDLESTTSEVPLGVGTRRGVADCDM
jgi:hypothetical protein